MTHGVVVEDIAAAPGGERRRYAAQPAELRPGTLVDLFLNAVDRYDRKDAQLYRTAAGWQTISHAAMLRQAQQLVAGLRGWGVARGERVGLLSENRPEWATTDYGLLCGGMWTVPVYPTLPAPQIAHILRHAGVRVLFVSTAEQLEKVLSVAGELAALEHVVVFDDAPPPGPVGAVTVTSLRALLEAGAATMPAEASFREEAQRARPEDVATLIYTSGTTGEPKGVMLTHNNIYSNVLAATQAVLVTRPDDIAVSFLPLSHSFQRMVDYTIFGNGTPIAYVPVMEDVARALEEVRPTLVAAVPRVYEKLYARILSATGVKRRLVLWARGVALEWSDVVLSGARPGARMRWRHGVADRLVFGKVRAKLGGRLRFFISGSAPLSPQIARFFHGAGVLILEGYGLTETAPVTNANTPTAMRIGTVGPPLPGTEIMLAADGEILVRGPQVMKGYYRNEQATREVIDQDGWFHTGDIGELDDDGFLRITDRKKDLLVTAGGKNVAPQPLQNAAKQSRFIAEALLIGDRRPYTVMLVVPNFETLEAWLREQGLTWETREQLVTLPQVRQKLEQEVSARLSQFARYEVPKKVLPLAREFSLEAGEITPSLKVKRGPVEEHNRDRIEALYAEAGPGEAS